MAVWLEPRAVDVSQALAERVGGHPLVAQTLVRRGITEVAEALAFLDPERYTPADPFELPQMDRAVERIGRALERGEKVCVWGDFDVDGQTSTTLLVQTLGDLGAKVDFHIPLRQTESHGMTLGALQTVLEEGAELVLTCDTGVAEHEAIAYAQRRGVDVVVTDHHALPKELPCAHALVNPQMLPPEHGLRTLPGVGCAYKLAEALYGRAGQAQRVERHLDLVALGIVADVAVQTGDARYLLQRGLEALRHTGRVGLQALFKAAQLDPRGLNEEHVGFTIGPRLNALGRLGDARLGVALLTTDDPQQAQLIATQLEGLNARRRLLCDQVFQAALAKLEADTSLLGGSALVLSQPTWPAGVIGIVASRLVERFFKPVVLIAAPPGELARGSARSVAGVNIVEAIAAQRALLQGFGGHPMAAGLAIEAANIGAFRQALSRTIERQGGLPPAAGLQIDGTLGLDALSLAFVADLERLAPFGPGNPPLTLVSKNLSLTNPRSIGRNGEHRQLIVRDGAGNAQKVMWWRGGACALPRGKVDLAYRLKVSDFQGKRELQLEWIDARSLEAERATEEAVRAVEVVDCRQAPDPPKALKRLRRESEVQVWCEAETRFEVAGHGRGALERAPGLVVWTAPPSPQTLASALERVDPERVVVFGLDPGMDGLHPFLNRLGGLMKYALARREGKVNRLRLAEATSQTERAVDAGVAWLVAQGVFEVFESGSGVFRVALGDGKPGEDLGARAQQLRALLAESAAYRAYFSSAAKDQLFAFGR